MPDRVNDNLVSRLLTRRCRECGQIGFHRLFYSEVRPVLGWRAWGKKPGTICAGANPAWEQRVYGEIVAQTR